MDNKRYIRIAIALTMVIFIIDVRTPIGYADWLLYFIPFFVAAPALKSIYIPILPSIATLLIIASYFFSPPGGNLIRAAANRTMGILVLWWISSLIMKRKRAEEALDRSYREMEQRVADRTAEFRQINASLQSEITERRRAEETVRESEARLHSIASTALDAVILIDDDGRISFWNDAATRLFGYTNEEIVGKYLHSYLMPERHVDSFKKGFDTFRITGKGPVIGTVYETEAKRKDGTEFPVELSLSALRLKGRWNAIGIVRDISERKRAEEALRESEAGYRLLFKTMIRGVVYQDAEGKIVSMNPAAVKILGKTPEEFLGETSVSVEHDSIREDGTPFPGLQHPSMVALRTGREVRNVVMGVYNPREKAYRWIDINAMPLFRDGENRPYQVYTIFDDITERKLSEKNLKKTMEELERSNKDLEQFAYAVSHDLQEPLRTVSSFVDLLGEKYKGKLDQKADKYISYTVDGATRMSALINDLLAYSRVGTRGKQFAPVEMSSVFKKAAENLKKAIDEGRVVVTSDQLPQVFGDETQLIQLLQNLIGNALKFRKKDAQPRIQVSAERRGNQWLFGVHDNGIGIEPGFQERIFTVFQRLHTKDEYPGTGIGLAICRMIVERHEGRIWVESKPGEGSTFYFTLPAIKRKIQISSAG